MTPAGSDPASSPAKVSPLPAGIGRRWVSLIYEGFVLFALLLVAGFAALPLIGPPHTGPSYLALQLYLLPSASSAFLFFYYVMVTGIYCIGFWSNGRRTVAMKTWGLALVSDKGRPVDIRRATKRYLAAWIGPTAGLVGFYAFGSWGLAAGLLNHYWGWVDGNRQFLHDRIAGTKIIRR